MLPMLNFNLIPKTSSDLNEVQSILHDDLTNMKREIEELISSNLKTMREKKIDIDTNAVQKIIIGGMGIGFFQSLFQSKEDTYKEAIRLQKDGRFHEALITCLKYRNDLKKNTEYADSLETAEMYSEIGQAYVRQGMYPEAEKYYLKENSAWFYSLLTAFMFACRCYSQTPVVDFPKAEAEKLKIQWSNDHSVQYSEQLVERAKNGDPISINNLAICHMRGLGVKQDYVAAVKWLKKGAELGIANTQEELGRCYEEGFGVSKDANTAYEWYLKAAEAGYVDAQNSIGTLILKGACEEHGDINEGIKWINKAAEAGHPPAQFNLANSYQMGKGVAQNSDTAFKWMKKAAEQGDMRSEYNLGVYYLTGTGTTENPHEALTWFVKAANKGSASAQNNVASLYYNGTGMSRDIKEATKWFKQAAANNNAEAQYMLGSIYYNGVGVDKDEKEAAKYFKLAADQGHQKAKMYLMSLRPDKADGH
jgi:TPR repeat protein